MSTLYLIRNGQASFGSADYDDLSQQGRRQAQLLCDHLVRSGIRFDASWSATLRRQRQTAEQVRARFRQAGEKTVPLGESRALNEYDYETVLRGLVPVIEAEDPGFAHDVQAMFSDRRAFQTVFGRVMRRWAAGRDKVEALPSWAGFCKRVAGGMEAIMVGSKRGSHVAVFTSGGPIAAFVGSVLELEPTMAIALSWQLVNASVTRFQFSQGRVSLDTFNERPHLEGQGTESLVTYR